MLIILQIYLDIYSFFRVFIYLFTETIGVLQYTAANELSVNDLETIPYFNQHNARITT